MKILVIGGSSFVGKNFLLRSPSDWNVFATYHGDKSFPGFVKKLKHVTPLYVDLTDPKSISALASRVSEADCVLYLAANSNPKRSVTEPVFDLQINTLAVIYVLEKIKCKKFIYISSGAVYIDDLLPYKFSKFATENYVKFFAKRDGFDYVNVRFFETFGPYSSKRKIFRKLVEQFDAGNLNVTLYGDGKGFIDRMYIDDTVLALQKIVTSRRANVTLDLCTGHPLTILGLVYAIAKVFNIAPRISFKGEAAEHVYIAGDPKPMKKIFGFAPTISIEGGVRRWMKFKESNNGKY